MTTRRASATKQDESSARRRLGRTRPFAAAPAAQPARAPAPGAPLRHDFASVDVVAQRFTDIDLDEAQSWEEVRAAFPSFKPTVGLVGDEGQERFEARYVEGPPVSSKLSVSDAGRLAISADRWSQHTAFFLTPGKLRESNVALGKASSEFLLAPTGVSVTVHNHPAVDDVTGLAQVEASAEKGSDWAKQLTTLCNIFYQNITRSRGEFQDIVSMSSNEAETDVIHEERREALDETLGKMALEAGDAFEIKSLGNSVRDGWNEHYAGIVAVDGADSVTLENYNRDAEFRDKVDTLLDDMFGKDKDGLLLKRKIDGKRKTLKSTWWWSKKNGKQLKQDLVDEIDELERNYKLLTGILERSRRADAATHHFKMYGPAVKSQSFLDQWRGEMDTRRSSLKVAKAVKED